MKTKKNLESLAEKIVKNTLNFSQALTDHEKHIIKKFYGDLI